MQKSFYTMPSIRMDLLGNFELMTAYVVLLSRSRSAAVFHHGGHCTIYTPGITKNIDLYEIQCHAYLTGNLTLHRIYNADPNIQYVLGAENWKEKNKYQDLLSYRLKPSLNVSPRSSIQARLLHNQLGSCIPRVPSQHSGFSLSIFT